MPTHQFADITAGTSVPYTHLKTAIHYYMDTCRLSFEQAKERAIGDLMSNKHFTIDNPPEPFETVYFVVDDDVEEDVFDPNNELDMIRLKGNCLYPNKAEAEATI